MNFDKLDSVSRLTLNEGDVLLVKFKKGNLPKHLWEKYATDIKNSLQLYFLTNRIVIISDDIDITVIGKSTDE